jgi:hypothetical protein
MINTETEMYGRRTFLEEFGSRRSVYGSVHCSIDSVGKTPISTVLETGGAAITVSRYAPPPPPISSAIIF